MLSFQQVTSNSTLLRCMFSPIPTLWNSCVFHISSISVQSSYVSRSQQPQVAGGHCTGQHPSKESVCKVCIFVFLWGELPLLPSLSSPLSLRLQPLRDLAAAERLQPCDRPVRLPASRHRPGLRSLWTWILQPAQRAGLPEVRCRGLWWKWRSLFSSEAMNIHALSLAWLCSGVTWVPEMRDRIGEL